MEKFFISCGAIITVSVLIILGGRSTRLQSLCLRVDEVFFKHIGPLQSPRLLSAFIDITSLGSATLVGLGALIASMAFILNHYPLKAVLITVGACSGILGRMLKHFTGRDRPQHAQGYIFGSSFPSNHTLMSSSFYPLLYRLIFPSHNSKLGMLMFITSLTIPLLVGMSRIILRAHFFSDVFVGWLAGGIIVWACLYLL